MMLLILILTTNTFTCVQTFVQTYVMKKDPVFESIVRFYSIYDKHEKHLRYSVVSEYSYQQIIK